MDALTMLAQEGANDKIAAALFTAIGVDAAVARVRAG
jgi:hypothetical protein